MAMWYLSYDGKQIGPLDQAQASAQARQYPLAYAWREGFTAWVPISEIDELTSLSGGGRPAPPPPGGPREPTRSISRSSARKCSTSR